jgi:hypothetical protein
MPDAEARVMPRANHGWGPAQFPEIHRAMVAAWVEDRELPVELVLETVATHGLAPGPRGSRLIVPSDGHRPSPTHHDTWRTH